MLNLICSSFLLKNEEKILNSLGIEKFNKLLDIVNFQTNDDQELNNIYMLTFTIQNRKYCYNL